MLYKPAAPTALLGALLVTLSVALAATPAEALGTPADRVATHAYLAAVYSWARSFAANLPASGAAVKVLSEQIDRECPSVLAHEPALLPSPPSPDSQGARRRGEQNRQLRQREELRQEINFALAVAWATPDRSAAAALVAAIAPLQWSDQAVTRSVRLALARTEMTAVAAPPALCADIQAWVASGYTALSPATKEFIARREANAREDMAERPVEEALAPYEDARDKRLITQTRRLIEAPRVLTAVLAASGSLHRALGLPVPRAEPTPGRLKAAVRPPGLPKGAVRIARGRTAAGGRYTVVVEPRGNFAGSVSGRCRVSVKIESQNSGFSGCYSRSAGSRGGSVNCQSGLLTVRAQTSAAAHTVSLLLSDGRRIVSPVAIVPARLGGPIGIYFQVVRGPSPVPVALTERDAQGRRLTVIKLPRIVECTRNPIKYLPGGIRTLATESVPQGPTFAIVGKSYRFLGHHYFDLDVHVQSESEALFSGGGSVIAVGQVDLPPSPFSPQFESDCHPRPYEIVYGLLKAPGDTVLASAGGALYPLRQVAIPANMRAGGVLAYAALPVAPTELIVRSPTGKTVSTDKLEGIATEAFETCEGEAED